MNLAGIALLVISFALIAIATITTPGLALLGILLFILTAVAVMLDTATDHS